MPSRFIVSNKECALALFGYLRVTNNSGDVVEGDCHIAGYEHWIPIWSGHHKICLPTAPNGLPTGKRLHYPLTVSKQIDRTSPILHSLLSRGETLKEVVIDWYRVNPKTSETEAYFRQKLSDVQVSEIGFHTQSHFSGDDHKNPLPHSGHMESVQFIYDNIIWTYLDGGIEFEDQLTPKPAKKVAAKPQPPVKNPHCVLWQPECDDQLPIPDDYRATLLVYGSKNERVLSKQTANIAHESQSRTFQLANSEPFDAYFIEPTMQSVLDDLKANRHIKQSVSDGIISPLAFQGSDITPKGHTLHYAPVTLKIARQLQILMQGTHSQDITFELAGSNTLSETILAQEKTNTPLTYTPLDGSKSFALSAIEADLPPVSLLPSIPFADWLHKETLLAHGLGSKGGPQLLEHDLVKGHIPQLTFMPTPPQFGLFFDGTGNNKTNDNVDLNDDKEPTNIAKLSELYVRNDYSYSYYEEGIGTKAHEKDKDIDMATAYSLDEHINNSLKRVKTFFERFKNCTIGFIDIFGFSRGATQARMMVNIIHYLNEHEPAYWGGLKVIVRFVGLYDTVGSIGIGGDNDNQWCFATESLPGAPDTATLDIAPNAACAIYHLTALDEERENFPLSSLQTSKNGSLPTHFIEQGVPGAHADVGGGYGAGESIIRYPSQNLDYFKREATPQRVAADKKRLKQELETAYYRPGINIEFEESSWFDHQNSRETTARKMALKPYWKRQVSNQLSIVYLAAMHKKALEFGVPLDPLTELDNFKHPANNELLYKYDTPDKLEQLCQKAISQGVKSEAYQTLSEHYIHHSHRFVGLTDTVAFSPESKPKHEFGHYGREVFYAQDTGLGDQGTWEIHGNQKGSIQWYKN